MFNETDQYFGDTDTIEVRGGLKLYWRHHGTPSEECVFSNVTEHGNSIHIPAKESIVMAKWILEHGASDKI